VLIHLLNGLTDASIARRLDTSLRVVERDVHFIKDLAGVSTRLEIAWRLGFGGGS
jgi:DNA-binding NarL/FixJ family response regulator